jgi:uncharacterized protein
MSSLINYFPLGIAKSDAFCNRVLERKRLKQNVERGIHTVVVSPRRYGKSSLVQYMLNEMKLPFVKVDFFIALDEQVIEKEITEKANKLINKIGHKHEALILKLKELMRKLSLKLILGTDGVQIEVTGDKKTDVARNIASVLQLLEAFLKEKKQRAVFFIDEFQEVSVVAASKGIEGAIRSVAQESEYLSFIFSGSSRHLLGQMFEDRSRPLYKLCDKMALERIERIDYIRYIQHCAKKTWRAELGDAVIEQFFMLTERHPYYLNLLCGRVWQHFETKPPSLARQVQLIWQGYLEESKSEVARELSNLTDLQVKLLMAIARGEQSKLIGKAVVLNFNVTQPATSKALAQLEQKDYIVKEPGVGVTLIDPLIKAILIAVS